MVINKAPTEELKQPLFRNPEMNDPAKFSKKPLSNKYEIPRVRKCNGKKKKFRTVPKITFTIPKTSAIKKAEGKSLISKR